MKRITRTLAAASMAGAVAIAAVPTAQAQQTSTSTQVVNENLPQAILFADGTYKELVDGAYVTATFTGTEEERALLPIVTENNENWVISFQDGRLPLTVPKPAEEVATPVATTENTLSPGAIAGITAAAIIPVVIAGVTYYLNQDGETLVGSSDRVNQAPTPEEKAESDRLRAEHAEEIAAQQEAAVDAARGISAETGSNTLARTLFALLVAVVLGSAAFFAGRRFLI